MQHIRYPVIGKEKNLPVYLSGIGMTEYEYHVNRENGLVSHQVLFTAKGSGRLHIDGKTYRLDKGKLFYVSPSVPHEYYAENDSWSTCWVVFRGNNLSQLMTEMGFPSYFVCETEDINLFERLFGMLLAADDPVFGGEKCSLLLYEYILEARRLYSGENANRRAEGAVGAIASYIDENYMRDITLESLSQRAGVSPQHFCRLFRSSMGMRPLEYIARRRIAQAKLLLSETDEPVADIGVKTGYPDPTYFGVVFRKYEGISPSEYRRRRNNLAI